MAAGRPLSEALKVKRATREPRKIDEKEAEVLLVIRYLGLYK